MSSYETNPFSVAHYEQALANEIRLHGTREKMMVAVRFQLEVGIAYLKSHSSGLNALRLAEAVAYVVIRRRLLRLATTGRVVFFDEDSAY